MSNKEFHKEYLIAYEDYKDDKEMMNDDCFRYCYKSHNSLSKQYMKEHINEYIDRCTDIKEMQDLYNKIKKSSNNKTIEEWFTTIYEESDFDSIIDFIGESTYIGNEIWDKSLEALTDIIKETVANNEEYRRTLIQYIKS